MVSALASALARALVIGVSLCVLAGCSTIGDGEVEVGPGVFPDAVVWSSTPRESGWREWRGTFRDGVSPDASQFESPESDNWPESWRVPVGSGVAGLVAADGRVFCHAYREQGGELVVALDAETGDELWSKATGDKPWDQPFEAGHIAEGPLATPALSGGRIYTVGSTGRVRCLDASDGSIVFDVEPAELDASADAYRYGHAVSPLVKEGRLFFGAAADDGQFFALDADTGDVLWRALGETVAYASPVFATMEGEPQVIVRSWEYVRGLAIDDGRVLWEHEAPGKGMTRDCATPLVVGSVVYLSSRFHGTIAVRVGRSGDEWTVDRIYRSGGLACGTSSPLYHDGYLYGLHRAKRFACIDAETGVRQWVERSFGEHLSIIGAGGSALALDERGSLSLLTLSPEGFRAESTYRVGSYTWAHPAIDGTRLFLRDGEDVVCLSLGDR